MKWWWNDKNSGKNSTTRLEIDNMTARTVEIQMVNKPTSFLTNVSCIHYINSLNTNFVKNWGSNLLIYQKCHHNIICRISNFDVHLTSPCYRDVSDYKHANTEKKAISTSKGYFNVWLVNCFPLSKYKWNMKNTNWNFTKRFLKTLFSLKLKTLTIKLLIGWMYRLNYL